MAPAYQCELSQTRFISHWVKSCKGPLLCVKRHMLSFQTFGVSISSCHFHRALKAGFNHMVISTYWEHRLTLLRKQLARSSGFSVHVFNSFRKVLGKEKYNNAFIFYTQRIHFLKSKIIQSFKRCLEKCCFLGFIALDLSSTH